VTNLARLRNFVVDFTRLVDDTGGNEATLIAGGKGLLGALIRSDDWLPETFAFADPLRYRQYLLHCDPLERFSVVSFVWDRGQSTPIHNHTVWGLVGVLRGAEVSTRYEFTDAGTALRESELQRFEAGEIDAVSPSVGDIHRVSNAYRNAVSVSIHVYGGNIGALRRATFDLEGRRREFISGYSGTVTPNVWDRSRPAP
jgi:predicted metal-dependent enzyme (double-stranded beta helix superfamily)